VGIRVPPRTSVAARGRAKPAAAKHRTATIAGGAAGAREGLGVCPTLVRRVYVVVDSGAGLYPARRFTTGAGGPVYKRSWRVTNRRRLPTCPTFCRIQGSGKSMWHWALLACQPAFFTPSNGRGSESVSEPRPPGGGWHSCFVTGPKFGMTRFAPPQGITTAARQDLCESHRD